MGDGLLPGACWQPRPVTPPPSPRPPSLRSPAVAPPAAHFALVAVQFVTPACTSRIQTARNEGCFVFLIQGRPAAR